MKKAHILGLLIIAAAIAIIITAVGDASSYQSIADARQMEGKEFHLIGQLVKDMEVYYEPEKDPNYFTFHLQDENGDITKVVFNDAKPQDFDRSEQIVMVGSMQENVFHADEILLKCPSKYDKDGKMELRSYKAES